MKIILLLISTIAILNIDPSFEVPYAKIENAFNSNDAKTIISFGKDKILLKIIDKEGAYSHTQAELILQDFFTKKFFRIPTPRIKRLQIFCSNQTKLSAPIGGPL